MALVERIDAALDGCARVHPCRLQEMQIPRRRNRIAGLDQRGEMLPNLGCPALDRR